MKRVVAVAMLAVGCGGLSISSFQDAARAAKGCDVVLDRCVNAGAAQCLCPTPVNAKRAVEINDLAKQVACGGATVECAQSLNPRCVAPEPGALGTCVSDIQ